jgi:uncharacterized DUF497 family protein
MYIQLYADGRLFSWDERKNAANLAGRGVDFEFASWIFAGPRSEVHMKRKRPVWARSLRGWPTVMLRA